MMKALALLPLVSSYQVMDTHEVLGVDSHESYEGMRSTLKGISAMQTKGEIDSDTINTVEEILENITNQLLFALDQDKIHAQNILDAAEAGIEKCDQDKRDWKNSTGPYATMGYDRDVKGSTMEDCRNSASLTDDEQDLCVNATTHCNTYQNQVCGWKTSACQKPARGRFSNGDTDELHTYMTCLENFFNSTRSTYYSNRNNCLNAVNAWELKTTECDTAQENFEKAFCDVEKNIEDACKQYRECRDTQQTNYINVKNQVQELQQIFQAQRVALACLQCYGQKILDNSTDLDSCERPNVKCTDFTDCPIVVFDDIPSCIPCTEPDMNPPCSEGFIASYYGYWDGTCTPAATCKACNTFHASFSQNEKSSNCTALGTTEFDQR